MKPNRRAPGSVPGRYRSILITLMSAVILAPACTGGSAVPDDAPLIVAASTDRVPPPPPGQSPCDDGNPCTYDIWDGPYCAHEILPDGTPCDDGDVCNGTGRCDPSGTCQMGSPPEIDDGNDCTTDTCDPVTGPQHIPNTGQPCTGGCGVQSTCDSEGVCGAPPLDDGNPCTADLCSPELGVVHKNEPSGTMCDDENPCNGIARCDGFGTCEAGPIAPSGTSCSDGEVCNGVETCSDGRCWPGVPPVAGTSCDDGAECTELDACDGMGACVGITAPAGTSCDDGNACTTGDECDGNGSCEGSAQGAVQCGDGDACNGIETCVAGECVAGAAPSIDDGNPTTLDTCDPATGAVVHTECGTLKLTVPTTVADMVECLYSGPSPVQTGMTSTIDPLLAGAVHGTVLSASHVPLPGTSVTLRVRDGAPPAAPALVPSGYGTTLTRLDGAFDLAVNGGGTYILEYSHPGYLPAQREVTTEAGRFVSTPDVVLKALDPAVSTIEIDPGTTEVQVARASVVTDERGTRQVTVLFKPGTTATLEMPDGTTSALPAGNIHVRATEYTVGPEGPSAMPGTLPPSSAYTYAVDLTVDEAIAAGARSVIFDPPVVAYLENFLGLPAGENIPSGSYRADAALWEVAANGRVVELTGVTNGAAEMNVDADAGAETSAELAAIGIDLDERQRIAELYSTGQTLWRIPVAHFTPWDWNMGYGPAPGSQFPDVDATAGNPGDDACKRRTPSRSPRRRAA
ncbi:MAG: carboxypeptidase-like regulatory domain-containing protein [Polyangiaceae bacterium]